MTATLPNTVKGEHVSRIAASRLGMFLTLGNYSGSPTASHMQIIGGLDRNPQTISAEEKHLETQLPQELH